MRGFLRLIIMCPAVLALVLAGCQRQPLPAPPAATQPPSPAPRPAARAEAPKDYRLEGVVLEVDRKANEVKIDHKAVPGLMPAMKMSFPVKDPALLDDLRPGDEVEGLLRVSATESDLVELTVTRPALEGPLTIDLSGGMATLRPKQPVLKPGEPVPDFTMTTQEGKTLKLSDLRGNVVVLTFIYTRCPLPDFCPLIDRKFKELARQLALIPRRAQHARLLSVSFDPEHDTPDVLARHARLQGAEPPLWTFAVASREELHKIAPSLGLAYGPAEDQIAHSLSTAIIDPEGKLVRLETGRKWDPTEVFKTIYPFLAVSRR